MVVCKDLCWNLCSYGFGEGHVAMICRDRTVTAMMEALDISLLLHISISYLLHKNMLDYGFMCGHESCFRFR